MIELDEVRAALDAALHGPDALLGGELLAQFSRAWGATGLYKEGLARSAAFIAAIPQSEPSLLARLATSAVLFATEAGEESRALEIATRAVAYARVNNEGETLATSLIRYANTLVRLSRFEDAATALLEAERSTQLSSAGQLLLLAVKAHLDSRSGDYAAAARSYEHLKTKYRSLGNVDGEVAQTINLAEAEYQAGHIERAIQLLRELLPLARVQINRITLVQALINLGGFLATVDDADGTCGAAREAITEFASRDPEAAFVAAAIELLALGLALRGDDAGAATLAGYAAAAIRNHGWNRQLAEITAHERLTALLRERLLPNELASLLADGAALSAESAVARALAAPPL